MEKQRFDREYNKMENADFQNEQQLEDERIQAELSMLRVVNELHLKH